MKNTKVKKTKKQIGKKILKIFISILIIIAILACVIGIVNFVGIKSNSNFISNISNVSYDEQLKPSVDDNGYYTFVTDRDFKVLQLTDVHIGAGFMSIKKDNMSLNAVESMVRAEKPDLVVVTGDIAYPVPIQAGTFNNKTSAKLFAELMENLGVYWCLSFGNHDTEAYSYFSRETIAELYESDEYPHCLFQKGSDDVDGAGNYIINVKNSKGEITQSLVMFDSHSYIDNDYFGILWKYDCVHKNQIEWYENAMNSLAQENNGKMPKSLAFFHIPLKEMRDAYYEYRDNDYKDTQNVKYIYGKAGEKSAVVYTSENNYGLFESFSKLGSTQGVFFGHDHLNNFSLDYKGIRLTYGYSIDYLAYSGISKFGSQRGCTVITVSPNGTFDCKQENYYQDKYKTVNQKEDVTFDDYYADEDDNDNEE